MNNLPIVTTWPYNGSENGRVVTIEQLACNKKWRSYTITLIVTSFNMKNLLRYYELVTSRDFVNMYFWE
jgi:hypothetical protein